MHSSPALRWTLAPALAAALALPGARADLLGQGAPGFTTLPRAAVADAAAEVRAGPLRAPGFDPVRDVPFMKNWVGDIDSEGSGNCYAISVLTAYMFRKVEFTGEEGVPFERWEDAADRIGERGPLSLEDDAGLDFLYRWLAVDDGDLEEHGRLKVGDFESLRDMTRPGSRAEARFRDVAEAIQFHVQVVADAPRYIGSIVRGNLGFLPGGLGGRDRVNRSSIGTIRDRLERGWVVPVTLHDAGLRPAGHELVVYEVRELDDRIELVTYDCNSPPSETEADPAVITVYPEDGYRYEVHRTDGRRRYRFDTLTVPDPESRRSRRKYRDVASNYGETLERNRHLGDLVGKDRSILTRAKGGAGFVLEVLNPF